MTEVTTIGLDIGKRVLQAHGADAAGRAVLQRKLRREEVHAFFAALPSVWSAWRGARLRIVGRGSFALPGMTRA